ncbi:Ubiquitin-like domain-containing protein [Psidium guajava]|nr:Ubiquitin-like domain-containing protein [Psidium guajava]
MLGAPQPPWESRNGGRGANRNPSQVEQLGLIAARPYSEGEWSHKTSVLGIHNALCLICCDTMSSRNKMDVHTNNPSNFNSK